MREQFIDKRFTAASQKTIEQANEIIEAYQADGIQLTLRQLYYQFVSRNWLENNQRNYKNLGNILNDARLAGLVDWRAIDDLGRIPAIPYFYDDLDQFVEQMRNMANGYSLDLWTGQDFYVELHVEKQALSSVLAPIAEEWGIAFSMNKGYSSATALYRASKRFIEAAEAGREGVVIYCGDHDPSGEDMVRDVHDRLSVFGADVEVRKVALTMEQVKRYKCPPNPAKTTDIRSAAYIREHGRYSWEIDALEPKALRKIVSDEIKSLCDMKKRAETEKKMQEERERVSEALEKIDLE